MAWTYTNWESGDTDTDRLASLRLHIAEVSASLETWNTSVSANSYGKTKADALQYLQLLFEQRDRLEGKATRANAGGRSLVRFIRER